MYCEICLYIFFEFALHLNKICIHSKSILIKMSNFLSRQAAKEQEFFLNILRGSKKGKKRAGPYPKETLRKSTSRQITPEGSGSIRPEYLFGRISQDVTEEFANLPQPQIIIEAEAEVGDTHETSSIHGETGASQEIESRKRRREDDDGIFN